MKEIVKLENVSKSYEKNKYIIKNLTLSIYEKEFVTLLGSSGCGKTTILRLISGLENVTNGKVFIDNIDVTNIIPAKREVNTIFQNFALFPHMNVFDNVAFGLKMKKVNPEDIKKRVKKVLNIVELEGFENRYPSQLSGGQQQRVAIARGIIMNPKVLLLDESLGSLDLKLKRTMQIELKKIQKKLGITFIYVTHNQDEALTMSDRIVIINNGNIVQDGTPQEIYENPKNTFVADFIGESNILNGIINSIKENTCEVIIKDNLSFIIDYKETDKKGDKISIMIRPEKIKISTNHLKDAIEGIIKDIIYDGAITKLFVEALDIVFKVTISGVSKLKENETVYIKIDDNDIVPIRREKNDKKQ